MAESAVLIVGGGPSGLATAACLTQSSIPYLLLEREDCHASLWKKKAYDRLHLHLSKHVCELPHFKMPPTYPKYVPRKQFIQYLDNYADHFQINPLYKRRVISAKYVEDTRKWHVKAKNTGSSNDVRGGEGVDEEYMGKYLVVATGETSDPFYPRVEGLSSFTGEVLHSTEYKSGKVYEGKRVLVVGAGNSGMEIALDLANHGAKSFLVVRSPVHIVSREMMDLIPLLKNFPMSLTENLVVMLSKLVYRDLDKYGITRPHDKGPFSYFAATGKFPVIDVGTYQKIRSGDIQVLPSIRSIEGNDVFFSDGKCYPFDAIIFATGFKSSTNQWLEGDKYQLNEKGLSKSPFPNHWKGKDGLYYAGLSRRGLYGLARDAENIAQDIAAHM